MIRTYLKVVKAFRTGVCGRDGDNMARQHYGHKKHMNKFTITGIIAVSYTHLFFVSIKSERDILLSALKSFER